MSKPRQSDVRKTQQLDAQKFDQLPISPATISALTKAGFKEMTAIQKAAIPIALSGRDVLGAAKTGSGKTLAFLVPVLEQLLRSGWNQALGLGAIILSPTRELALQIFEVLRKVGNKHKFSAGLVIGGRSVGDKLKGEQARIVRMNILVCTPGRLLQHMDSTPGFSCDNLCILVLDEADRILDMGFEKEVNAIVENLPQERQTLLFSATQTKSIKKLARLSLRDPEYVFVHENKQRSTPSKLQQHYIVLPSEKKIDFLYSFLKTHLKNKIIVFVSTCKQTQYLFEVFRRMKPGISLSCIHGRQSQAKRMALYYDFFGKSNSVLFSTDLAARGLDFKDVDWVLQFDCPEDEDMYIHRVGRTARYKSKGYGLLLLLPSEIKMVEKLNEASVPLKAVNMRTKKLVDLSSRIQSFLAEDKNLKYLAEKAFICYVRSVFFQSDKMVFDVNALDAAALAASMGLLGAPNIKHAQSRKVGKNQSKKLMNLLEKPQTVDTHKSKIEKLLTRQNTTMKSRRKLLETEGDSDDEFMSLREKPTSNRQDANSNKKRNIGTEQTTQLLSEDSDSYDESEDSETSQESEDEVDVHNSIRSTPNKNDGIPKIARQKRKQFDQSLSEDSSDSDNEMSDGNEHGSPQTASQPTTSSLEADALRLLQKRRKLKHL